MAEELLAKETDFFKFLKLLRVTEFVSKITLRKYQRNLVPFFKKYRLPDLDDGKSSLFTRERFGSKTMQLLEGEEFEELRMSENKTM